MWLDPNGDVKLDNGQTVTGVTYVLSSVDVASIEDSNEFLQASVVYTDGLGYESESATPLAVFLLEIAAGASDAVVTFAVSDPASLATPDDYLQQWQQSATEDGVYTNIDDATGAEYSVPAKYDAGRIFVRLSLSYESVDDINGTRLPAFSAPLRVAGLASGAVGQAAQGGGNGSDVGSSYGAALDALLDVLGRAPDASALTYQWQTGDSGAGDWQPITGATLQTYALATVDFGAGRPFLRVVAADRAANSASSAALEAPGSDINSNTTGDLRHRNDGGDNFRAGGGIFREHGQLGGCERSRRVGGLCLDGVSR